MSNLSSAVRLGCMRSLGRPYVCLATSCLAKRSMASVGCVAGMGLKPSARSVSQKESSTQFTGDFTPEGDVDELGAVEGVGKDELHLAGQVVANIMNMPYSSVHCDCVTHMQLMSRAISGKSHA